jgi:hypothetical protein
MSVLREEWLRVVRNGKRVKVNGFSGVGTLFDNGGHQVCIVAADEDALFAMVKEFMPAAKVSGIRFQKVTVIKGES